MNVQITKTTDGKYVGMVIDLPVDDLGILTMRQIQAITINFAGGQFVPTHAIRDGNKTRLISSNYSIEVERING